jgi:pyruvate/2-oxoglutarate dehydrogenase complex dihydrolipoamide dehydrogenase (E3) component
MDTYDFVIIGAGPGGEAAANKARELGASVAVVDARWFGGSCPHIGCVPSKALLNSAARHAANPAAYDWARASARRDYMINRAADAAEPDDTGHVRALEAVGAVTYRGVARIVGAGRVAVTHDGVTHALRTRNVVVAVGSHSKTASIEGIDAIPVWTNRDATLARTLPASLLILGGGPTGCELAQVYARFGVPTTIVQSGPRLAPTDHPRNSEAVRQALERDGVTIRLGVRAVRATAASAAGGPHTVELDDGTTAAGHAVMLAVGRSFAIDDLGLEHYGVDTSGRTMYPRDGRLRVADGLWIVGDPAGPELHTHQAHYQGELAVRMALGDPVQPDYRALPRATYTDPEADARRRAGGRTGRLRARRGLPQDRQGLLGGGHHRPRDDRRRPRHPRTRGGRHGLPRRVRRDPRMRPRDQGAGPGRRARGDHPRVPVDLADPQRALRRRPPRARSPGERDQTRRLAPLEDDLAVEEDQ